MEQLNNQNPTYQEAVVLINQLLFPAAVAGDRVKQYGYWFELAETGWVASNAPIEGNINE